MNYWLTLIVSLPTENATARMRVWRTLKASGAAALRDGVYLLPGPFPGHETSETTFNALAEEVKSAGGNAHTLWVFQNDNVNFPTLFDRSEHYAALCAEIFRLQAALASDNAIATLKEARKLRKTFTGIVNIDFFPDSTQKNTETALVHLEKNIQRTLSPDEPLPIDSNIQSLDIQQFQNQLWATRQRPWVDRLASAWLIKKYIDTQATFLWLGSINDCPDNALGFDFDGARFTHVDTLVTFEVLMASFNLEQDELKKLAALVHFLDVGGKQPNEATGVEKILAGLRETINDDNELLKAASHIFNGLIETFRKESK